MSPKDDGEVEHLGVDGARAIHLQTAPSPPRCYAARARATRGTGRTSCVSFSKSATHDLKQYTRNTHLTTNIMRRLSRHLLLGVAYMRRRAFLHRDFKPQNLLIVRAPLTLRIGDFGLARSLWDHHGNAQRTLTVPVCTLWYRPLEQLLGSKQYGYELDMQGVGCVIGEMVTKHPLFAGGSEIETIFKILASRGAIRPDDPAHAPLTALEHYSPSLPRFNGYGALVLDAVDSLAGPALAPPRRASGLPAPSASLRAQVPSGLCLLRRAGRDGGVVERFA